MDNPQYPHTCTIYRTGGDSFTDAGREEVYKGKCRKERNTSIRNFATSRVSSCDYRLSIPGFQDGIRQGDTVDVADRSGTWEGITILDVNVTNFGTEVFFNIVKS